MMTIGFSKLSLKVIVELGLTANDHNIRVSKMRSLRDRNPHVTWEGTTRATPQLSVYRCQEVSGD